MRNRHHAPPTGAGKQLTTRSGRDAPPRAHDGHPPPQTQLAKHMKTKSGGTGIGRVLTTLNQMAGRHTYDFNNVGSATRMRNEIRASVNRSHAVYGSVWSQWKPWRKTGTRGPSHATVAYGYSDNTTYCWDPADNSRHTASANNSYAAMRNRGMRITTG
ncbi:C39 family peptidase [Actinomadura kijaniata]|uniref:C39 family peptidase n=1 Tax=Actinomadura kijaniata TaxID=46161 RepID=UPI003F1A0DAB